MHTVKSSSLLANQRGVALPMAMLALLMLTVLVLGFSVLASTEPTIANNQLAVAQARALAEAGVERAMWALNNPADVKGIPTAFVTAPAPYDGSQLVSIAASGNTVGGFRVTVTNGAVGWVPNDTVATPRAHQKITVTVFNPQFVMKDPPAALSVRGELQIGGNSLVDSRSDTSCGRKVGTLTAGATTIQGNATDVWGAETGSSDANLAIRNQVTDAASGALPVPSHDIVKNLATTLPPGTPGVAFDQFILTDADISVLRAFAKAHGTYLQGTQTFNSSNKLPNGLVFVDTLSGNNITLEGITPATPASDFAAVDIHGNSGSTPITGDFNGWLFVNGALSISGNFQMNGFAYVQNDISYHGTGTGGVSGAMVSRNVRDLSSTSIDSDLLGNANIAYNCHNAKTGGDTITARWSMKGGTYKEVSGS